MVDNCYGEFTEKLEPTQVGADLIAGSLIKNAGGGIAACGGYIAGRKDLVEALWIQTHNAWSWHRGRCYSRAKPKCIYGTFQCSSRCW